MEDGHQWRQHVLHMVKVLVTRSDGIVAGVVSKSNGCPLKGFARG
ncbi:MAG: hypothetical protein Q4D85_05005 [Corynebacterium sp.]|nr:hypothetical protein [Corynebacterium sp.]MDO5098099.1 hypothetical protein [Corynebacterium sp.]